MIDGYKCFDKNMNNRYGMHFEENNTYSVDSKIKYGNHGNGFHFCARLEDTLRFFNALEEEISLCRVLALGNYYEMIDDYYGYYNMYVTDKIKIVKKMERLEILQIVDEMNNDRFIRFIQGFKLTVEELIYFETKYKNEEYVLDFLNYYQKDVKDVFTRKRK